MLKKQQWNLKICLEIEVKNRISDQPPLTELLGMDGIMSQSRQFHHSGRGYCYMLFESEKSVKALLNSCDHEFSTGGDWYFKISSRRMRCKEVQVVKCYERSAKIHENQSRKGFWDLGKSFVHTQKCIITIPNHPGIFVLEKVQTVQFANLPCFPQNCINTLVHSMDKNTVEFENEDERGISFLVSRFVVFNWYSIDRCTILIL